MKESKDKEKNMTMKIKRIGAKVETKNCGCNDLKKMKSVCKQIAKEKDVLVVELMNEKKLVWYCFGE